MGLAKWSNEKELQTGLFKLKSQGRLPWKQGGREEGLNLPTDLGGTASTCYATLSGTPCHLAGNLTSIVLVIRWCFLPLLSLADRYLKSHFNATIVHRWCSLVSLFAVPYATSTFVMGLASSSYCFFPFFPFFPFFLITLVLLCFLLWCFFLEVLCLLFFIHFSTFLIRGLTQNFLLSM